MAHWLPLVAIPELGAAAGEEEAAAGAHDTDEATASTGAGAEFGGTPVTCTVTTLVVVLY